MDLQMEKRKRILAHTKRHAYIRLQISYKIQAKRTTQIFPENMRKSTTHHNLPQGRILQTEEL